MEEVSMIKIFYITTVCLLSQKYFLLKSIMGSNIKTLVNACILIIWNVPTSR